MPKTSIFGPFFLVTSNTCWRLKFFTHICTEKDTYKLLVELSELSWLKYTFFASIYRHILVFFLNLCFRFYFAECLAESWCSQQWNDREMGPNIGGYMRKNKAYKIKSRIRETPTLLSYADSSTDTKKTKQKLEQTPIYCSHSPKVKVGFGNTF